MDTMSILSESPLTDHESVRMFSRWRQENFFGYMMQHFEIDLLMKYGVSEFPGAETVVNPAWRELDRSRNSLQNKLRYRRARFAEMTLNPETEENPTKYKKWVVKKSDLLEEVENYTNDFEVLKYKIKNTKKHIAWGVSGRGKRKRRYSVSWDLDEEKDRRRKFP